MISVLNRRMLLVGAGMTVLAPRAGAASTRKQLTLELVTRELVLRAGQPATTIWRFAAGPPRLRQGDEVDMTVVNRLPSGVLIHWRGLNGAAALEPLLARGPIAAGGSANFQLRFDHAGTLLCDARLGGEAGARPLPSLPIVVGETAPIEADRDEVLLIEDWRLRADGSAMPPGVEPGSSPPIYTINGQNALKLDAQLGERLRLRLINGSQRTVIAIQLSDSIIRVIAIDGQPSEPFPARDGRLVMAPGTRIDVLVDLAAAGQHAITLNDGERSVTLGEIKVGDARKRPQAMSPATALPSNGLPDNLQLQSALRIDVPLDPAAGWLAAAAMGATSPAVFRVKRGRTVVLALGNTSEATIVFHLHGHHMRLLDRLDDGWKPFWLDTVAIPARQTVRMAFAATYLGAYLMEMASTGWTSPKMLRSYLVDR